MSSVANTVGENIGSPTMKVCKGIIIAQIAFDVNHYDAQRRTERQPPTPPTTNHTLKMSWIFSNRLIQDFERLRSSPGLGAAYSEGSSSDGKPSAPWKSTPTPPQFCSPDKMKEFSRLSRFGMTFKPLTENLGVELLTWYLADSHAKTSVARAKVQASKASAVECGQKWPESLARYDHASRLWKTAQCSLLEGLDVYSETWPRWGTMRGGECWELSTPARLISENESGLWPTPCARDWKDNGRSPAELHRNSVTLATAAGGQLNPTWVEWLMGWPLGWTDLKPLATDKFPQWLRSHGIPCGVAEGSNAELSDSRAEIEVA